MLHDCVCEASAGILLHGIRVRGLRSSAANGQTNLINVKNRGMASSLPTEKLDRSNYTSWSYKMHQYLLGHGYWSYVDGVNDATP